jgi:hypothetical protein
MSPRDTSRHKPKKTVIPAKAGTHRTSDELHGYR